MTILHLFVPSASGHDYRRRQKTPENDNNNNNKHRKWSSFIGRMSWNPVLKIFLSETIEQTYKELYICPITSAIRKKKIFFSIKMIEAQFQAKRP